MSAHEVDMEEEEFDAPKTEEVGSEIDLTGDGGVMKKLLARGTGWEKPEKGAEVVCHYVGKLLDGTVFDSSRDRNEPFKFKLGMGQVIKGWDIGFAKMLKGEKALLTIKPENAYGAAGSPPKIPPNSTLQFEVELISWSSEEDISPSHDRTIMKKVLHEGEGWQKPKEDEPVIIDYTLRVGDTVVEEKKDFRFVIGAEEVVSGLEHAVQKMKKGEKALITVLPVHGYGALGNAALNIPPNTDLKYEIELKDWEKEKDSWKMSNEEKVEAALKAKNEGNELFKQGKVGRAHKKYKKAIDYIQYDSSFNDSEKEKAKAVKLPCYLNSCACHLKMKEWTKALDDGKKVLEIDSHSVKARFRRGQALYALDRWDEALNEFKLAKEHSSDATTSREIDHEIARVHKSMAEYESKEKSLYSKMFTAI